MAKRRRSSNISDLQKEYRTLTMRADKRLQRLEKYSEREGMEGILKGAYARAMRDIERWSGKGHKRFGTKAPSDPDLLRMKINDIRAFLRSDTSTLKPGIDTQGYAVSVYQKAANTFNSRYGGNFTWQELAGFYGSKKAARIAARIRASKTVARALGEFKKLQEKNPNRTREQWRKMIKDDPNLILSDDEVVNDAMIKMIRSGISPRTLFKGSK